MKNSNGPSVGELFLCLVALMALFIVGVENIEDFKQGGEWIGFTAQWVFLGSLCLVIMCNMESN